MPWSQWREGWGSETCHCCSLEKRIPWSMDLYTSVSYSYCRIQKRFCRETAISFPFSDSPLQLSHISSPCTQKSVTRTPWSYPHCAGSSRAPVSPPRKHIQRHLLIQHVRASHQVMQTTGKTAQECAFLASFHYFPAVLRTAPSTLWGNTKRIWWPSQWLDTPSENSAQTKPVVLSLLNLSSQYSLSCLILDSKNQHAFIPTCWHPLPLWDGELRCD